MRTWENYVLYILKKLHFGIMMTKNESSYCTNLNHRRRSRDFSYNPEESGRLTVASRRELPVHDMWGSYRALHNRFHDTTDIPEQPAKFLDQPL